MKEEVKATGTPDRLVIVQTPYTTREQQALCFAFTTRQVVEVRSSIKNRPVPFADSFVLGLCPWKNTIVPVIDLEELFGLRGKRQTTDMRYLVLKTGVSAQSKPKLYYAIVRVPAQINILNIDDIPAKQPPEEINSQSVRGIFHYQNQVLIVPDLPNILHVENGYS